MITVALPNLASCLRFVPTRSVTPNHHAVLCAGSFSLIAWGVIGTQSSWSAPAIWLPFSFGLVMLMLFTDLELRAPNPLIDLMLLGARGFQLPVLVLGRVNFVLFGILFVTPTYLQTIFGHDATAAEMMLLPVALTGAVGPSWLDRPPPSPGFVPDCSARQPPLLPWEPRSAPQPVRPLATHPMLISMILAGLGMVIGQSSGVSPRPCQQPLPGRCRSPAQHNQTAGFSTWHCASLISGRASLRSADRVTGSFAACSGRNCQSHGICPSQPVRAPNSQKSQCAQICPAGR